MYSFRNIFRNTESILNRLAFYTLNGFEPLEIEWDSSPFYKTQLKQLWQCFTPDYLQKFAFKQNFCYEK